MLSSQDFDLSGLPWGLEEEDCEGQGPEHPIDPECTSTYDGDIDLDNHEEMEAFCASWDCANGGLNIGGDESFGPGFAHEITDLSGLSCLKSARYMYIGLNANLTSISLPSLVWLNGGLSIVYNPQLKEIDVPLLTRGGGDLSIQDNEKLTSIELPNLRWLDTFFFIVGNNSLLPETGYAVRDGLCHVGGTTSVLNNGLGLNGSTISGGISRSGPLGEDSDGVGSLFVILFGGEHSHDLISFDEIRDADLSEPTTAIPYSIGPLPPRDDPYWLMAWLDDDESGMIGGASDGDARLSERISVTLKSGAHISVDLMLDTIE
jgi:hypothetical protein